MGMAIQHGAGKGAMKWQQGVSLVEVMVALVILMIGATGLSALQVQILRTLQSSEQQARALALAQGKLEELRSFTSIHHRPGTTAYQDITADHGGLWRAGESDAGALRLNWQVTDGPVLPDWARIPAYKTVDVGVIWYDGKQVPQRLVVQGIITPYAQATVQELGFDGIK
jgi:prepilin-type N-terminal cleavage/methylation domain-containing protein